MYTCGRDHDHNLSRGDMWSAQTLRTMTVISNLKKKLEIIGFKESHFYY